MSWKAPWGVDVEEDVAALAPEAMDLGVAGAVAAGMNARVLGESARGDQGLKGAVVDVVVVAPLDLAGPRRGASCG
jgi:hypothetical protein